MCYGAKLNIEKLRCVLNLSPGASFNSLRLGRVEKTLVKTRSPEVFCHMTIVTTFNAVIVI